MRTIGLLFSLAFLAVMAYVVVTFYMQYRLETNETVWGKLLAAAKHSATILWSKFVIIVACVIAQLDSIALMVGSPEAKEFIDRWLSNPKLVAGIMLVISFITIRARLRPSSADKLT